MFIFYGMQGETVVKDEEKAVVQNVFFFSLFNNMSYPQDAQPLSQKKGTVSRMILLLG